ncbi:MAG: hypothetical protein AAB295_10295, partial [Chloroflexota bacterium]
MLGKIPAARQEIINRIAARARRTGRHGLPVAPDRFARAYYHGVSELDLVQRDVGDLAGAALAQLALGRVRRPGRPAVRVFNPDPARDGFASSHTVIAVITDDMPFLVDSLGIVCTQSGLAVHLLAHPLFNAVRDRRGRLTDLMPGDAPRGAKVESWQLIEVAREADPERLAALERRIRGTLDDVRCATADWQRMRLKAREVASELGRRRPRRRTSEVSEAIALLEWMEDNHFTFLGYREYRLRRGRSRDLLQPVLKSGLGLMREGRRRKTRAVVLQGEVRDFARSSDPL